MKAKIWHNGKFIIIDDEMDFYVGRCAGGHTVFGEKAKFHKILANHLVFKTESGSLVKTKIDSLRTVGKADNAGYWVGIGDRTNDPNYINDRVKFWNDKKLCFEYK